MLLEKIQRQGSSNKEHVFISETENKCTQIHEKLTSTPEEYENKQKQRQK